MKMASLASKGIWASRETGVKSDLRAPGVRMALKVPKVARVPMETPVLSVLLERRENSACQGCPATRAGRAQRAPLASRDFQAPTARRAHGGHLANQVQGGNAVQRVHEGKEALGEALGNLAQRATLVVMAPLVLLANGDHQGLKDQPDFLDQKAPLVLLGRMDCLVTPDREEKPVSKARPARLAPLVL